jgi:TonB-dependent siderophore receptor
MSPRLALQSCLLLLAGAARAQAPEPSPTPSPRPRFSETVQVEAEAAPPESEQTLARGLLPLLSAPASVSVVPATVMKQQGGTVLTDALRNVPGVNVATGFGVFDYFVVRGFDSLNAGLVLTDGVPEPEATFYPLYNLRRVEVVRGPAAFTYGANPLAGAVNLLRKQPGEGRFAEVSLAAGSFGTYEGRLDANLARADGRLAFRLNGLLLDSDGFRDDKASFQGALNPSLLYRPDDRTSLRLGLEYVRAEYEPDTGLPITTRGLAGVPRTRSYQSPLDASRQDLFRLRLDAERRITDDVLLRTRAYYTDLEWSSDGTLLTGLVPFGPELGVARSLVLLDDRQKLLGNQTEVLASFRTGSVRHELVAGLEAYRLADDFTQDVAFLPPLSVFAPLETARRPVALVPGQSAVGDTRSLVFAPYLTDRLAFSDRLELLAGARLDALDYEDAATRTERSATRVSPLVGLVVKLTPRLSLYASAGTAFAPPSTLVAGPREPETSRQVELGARMRVGRQGLLSAAVYHLERRDIAIPDDAGGLRQAGDQRSRGFEAEMDAGLGARFRLSAAYAFTDAELTRFAERVVVGFDPVRFVPVFATVDRSGNVPAFAPRHLLQAWLSHRRGRLTLAGGARFVGRQFVAEDNAFRLEDYLLLDAHAEWAAGRTRFGLVLRNLTGEEYETRGFGGASAIPAAGFSLQGRVEIALGSR